MLLFRPPRWIDWFYPSCTWRFVVSDKTIFLTFDDGPHPDITPFILQELSKRNMKATFFCVGENLERFPELVKEILENGHAIGNHTMRHTKGSSVDNPAYFESVSDFSKVYQSQLFRPPYGKMKRSQRKVLSKEFRIVMWSWLSYDYNPSVPVEKILKKARSVRPGDILVLHDNPKISERQRELLPRLLDQLVERGFSSRSITA